MNKQELIKIIEQTFLNINSNWVNLIDQYTIYLRDWNKKVNLTRLDSDDKIYGSYFYDSIIPYKNVDFKAIRSILDIGSGSGIPGIVLKILYPHIKLDIIESNNKKVEFLRSLIKELQLDNINVFLKRAENIRHDDYESYDLVTSRAVGKIKMMLELSTPYAKVNGLVIIPKGLNYAQETVGLDSLCKKLGVTKGIDSFLSKTAVNHNVFFFRKKSKTNRMYPRPWAKILKDN